jgi:hypothetical protein
MFSLSLLHKKHRLQYNRYQKVGLLSFRPALMIPKAED